MADHLGPGSPAPGANTGTGGRRGTGLLLVMIDVDPECEDELNRWYEEEHLPERLACEGFLNARRFQAVEGRPKYLATYELESPEVLEWPAYQRLIPPTEWTRRVMAHFTDYRRNVYREITPELPTTKEVR